MLKSVSVSKNQRQDIIQIGYLNKFLLILWKHWQFHLRQKNAY